MNEIATVAAAIVIISSANAPPLAQAASGSVDQQRLQIPDVREQYKNYIPRNPNQETFDRPSGPPMAHQMGEPSPPELNPASDLPHPDDLPREPEPQPGE